ncbi:aldehyde dehydrogenase family protein [Nocardia africana]|uniref:Betaine aldehyde dehydrogenase n=1 Tax=Nocardia africana TaxID=134964 RepID=A0A378WXV6_9NOCA|nr:aldehyde dehydrogenase family protein [Nocardia africana]MCC3312969.1 aldehyde dehydrogenase family protein [Nocardia africana]SUA45692.1 Betaine aldehyde dehydrogenase [Nocardia africana]
MTISLDADIPAHIARHLDREFRLLIGGRSAAAASGRTYDVRSPATDTVIASVPDGDETDVEIAVAAAESARHSWRMTPAPERAAIVRRLADVIEEHAEELAALDAVDAGSPIVNARADVAMAVEHLRLFAALALEMKGATIPASANLHYTLREPIGICARIVPFNHPLMFACKFAAPLVAGNCVLVKPPEVAPLSSLRLGELLAGELPPGVLSILVGDGPAVPRAIARHPQVRRIGFIGSEPTGRALQREAAEHAVKDITLELGGKNAMLVFDDADLEKAAAGAVFGMNFTWSGQSCGSNSRLLVHESIAEEVTARVVAEVAARTVGSPFDEHCQQGPLVSQRQLDRAHHYIRTAVAEGATVLTGGVRPDGLGRGHYLRPTVLGGVTPQATVAREEVFGPVLSILTFDTEQQAVEIANSVDYGLTASVWTRDITRAHRVIGALDAGFTWINGSSRHFPNVPFGGYKASGVGREESLEELLSYTQTKAVNVLL